MSTEELKEFKITHTEKGILITNLNVEIKPENKYSWLSEYGWGGKITNILKNEAENDSGN